MYKNASRNRQRTSLKIEVGLDRRRSGHNRQLPTSDQVRIQNAKKLSRIRYCFELEHKIELARKRGQNVAVMLRELEAVRSGQMDPPRTRAPQRKPRAIPAVSVADRQSPERLARLSTRPDLSSSRQAIEVGLMELAKGKLTLHGVPIVKTLLTQVTLSEIVQILDLPQKLVSKLADSNLIQLAPELRQENRVVLLSILEERMQRKD